MATADTPKRRREWQAQFLDAFEKTGNVSEAAQQAGISRSHAYVIRRADEAFAQAWDDAEQQSHDTLEREAFRRASEGVDEPVFQAGKQVGTVRKYSDTLLIFLLKARRPGKYRENRIEVTGADGGPVKTELQHGVSLADVAAVLTQAGALPATVGGSVVGGELSAADPVLAEPR